MKNGFSIQIEGKKMTEKEQKIIDLLHDSEFEMLCKLDDVCKKHNLYKRFRWLMLRECMKNYNYLDSHQKKEYLLMILNPRFYRKRIERISEKSE